MFYLTTFIHALERLRPWGLGIKLAGKKNLAAGWGHKVVRAFCECHSGHREWAEVGTPYLTYATLQQLLERTDLFLTL